MMKKILFSTAILLSSLTMAQTESKDSVQEFNFNLLETPSDPAFIIMGNSNTEIEEPSDVSALKTSILNATDNLSEFPGNYALSIAPAWLIKGDAISYDEYLNNSKVVDNIWQSLQLSFGTSTFEESSENYRRLGGGVKFSIYRGSVNEGLQNKYESYFQNFHAGFVKTRDSLLRSDSLYQKTKKQFLATDDPVLEKQLELKLEEMREKVTDEVYEMKKQKVEELGNIKLERTGFFWDIAAAGAWNFYDFTNDIDSSDIYRWGGWTNFGWRDSAAQNSFIGMVRYLSFTNDPFITPTEVIDSLDYESLDLGLKYVWNPIAKFKISGEGIYRLMLNEDMEHTYRFMVNVSYDVGKNQIVNLALGRNFEGVYTREAEGLIYLGYVIGFGNECKLKL